MYGVSFAIMSLSLEVICFTIWKNPFKSVKLLYPPVQSFNPFAERTRNPLEFIMSKSMGWFLHSWNEKYAYFFCFVVLKISAHIVMPRLKGNKP